MTLKIEDAIEEIERALAGNKPKYANDIYLNNAIRYLQEIKSPSLTDDQQVVLEMNKSKLINDLNDLINNSTTLKESERQLLRVLVEWIEMQEVE